MQTSLWKRIVVWGICLLGVTLAAPNLFYARVEGHNDALAAVEKAGFATPEQEAAIAQWPAFLPSGLVNLGLDLRGGAHLLAEVRVADVYKARVDGMWPGVRDALRDIRDQVGNVRRQPSPYRQPYSSPHAPPWGPCHLPTRSAYRSSNLFSPNPARR